MPAKFSGDVPAETKLEVVQGPRNWCSNMNRRYLVAVDLGRKYAGKVIILESMHLWVKFCCSLFICLSYVNLVRARATDCIYWVACDPKFLPW